MVTAVGEQIDGICVSVGIPIGPVSVCVSIGV